jgi:hypothetical protein
MKTYVILRRCGWRAADGLKEAVTQASAAVEQMPDDVRWIRSYVLSESDGSFGTVCIYEATSPEAVRAHAERASLPVDEIVALAETLVVRPDPVETAA